MNVLPGVVAFLAGMVVTYYTVNAIAARYQFWDDSLPRTVFIFHMCR